MRLSGIATFFAVAATLLSTGHLKAQEPAPGQASPVTDNRVVADSAPYHIEWNGSSGTFVRSAFAQEPETRQPMTFLHTDPGPTGFAKYLAWFVSRDSTGFSLLWCYLNDSGSEFDCWLYRFPSNQLTSLHFTGRYQYTPPAEPGPPAPVTDLKLGALPAYAGPAFAYRDWTRVIGALPTLALQTTHRGTGPAPAVEATAIAKTITQVSVRPLHHVEVGAANGWREGGWNELHALAFDLASDPYYLILYSNTKKGYAVDLKRAQIYTADFGSRVTFAGDHQFGPDDNPLNTEPEIKVRRFDRHEIVLTSKEKLTNPYVDVPVGVELTGPDAKLLMVPGFWDGGGTFRVRFTPALTGRWRWRSLSGVADLNGQTGEFECINEGPEGRGFVNVQPDHKEKRHFSYSNGDPFLPTMLREPLPTFAPLSGTSRSAATPTAGVKLTGLADDTGAVDTSTFIAYQKFVNAAAQKGFNRLIGGGLLGPVASGSVRTNEGGAAAEGPDLDHINPAFFQWMDRRIAYCNARGIVPDIGMGVLEDALFTTYNPEALYRLWGYVVARYASFDVQWNLFEPGASAVSDSTRKSAEQFAVLTRLYDPNHHPLTVVVPGPTSAAAPAIAAPAVAGPAPSLDTTAPIAPPRFSGRFGPGGGRPGITAAPPVQKLSGSAMAGSVQVKKQRVTYDLPWEDVLTVLGGDVNALPYYTWYEKPLVMLERPTVGREAALTPEVTRHRMWEARMRGAYWAPGNVPSTDVASLSMPEIQWAGYCADIFRKTRFYRLAPRPEMLGGPSESSADRKRRKRAEAEEARRNPPPPVDDGSDFDPFSPDTFAGPPPAPAPKPTPMFVLADPAHEYLVYFEQGGTLMLDLLEATGKVEVTWFNPRTGEASRPMQIIGGAYTTFNAPDANDWVLYISRL